MRRESRTAEGAADRFRTTADGDGNRSLVLVILAPSLRVFHLARRIVRSENEETLVAGSASRVAVPPDRAQFECNNYSRSLCCWNKRSSKENARE